MSVVANQAGGEEKLGVHSKPELDHCSPCVSILDLQHSQPPAWMGRWGMGIRKTFEPVEEERPGQICIFGNINAPGLEGSESVSWGQTLTD